MLTFVLYVVFSAKIPILEVVFLNPQKKNEYGDNKTVGNESTNVLTSAPVLPPRCPLTVQQMIGLNRFEDLLERMDRAEVIGYSTF
jgi:hypothetical protein